MSKLIDKMTKIARRRRARRELRNKVKIWQSNGADCAEQGAGALGHPDLIDLGAEKMRRKMARAAVMKAAADKEERRRMEAERREARCRKYL